MQNLGNATVTVSARATRLQGGSAREIEETVAEETPITLAFNGVSQAVMMATPADLEDFATGFAITEGILASTASIESIGVVRYSRGIELQIETARPLAADPVRRRLAGRSGCGICGKEDVDAVLRDLPRVESTAMFSSGSIARAMRELGTRQELNSATGAVHAAAWANAEGSVEMVREDVGRHNALDKLIGGLFRSGFDAGSGFIVLTSRGSFELVQKTAIAGVALLCTVSAPTGLAIRVAHDAGITLAGFARDDRVTLYSHPDRVRA